MKSLLWVASFLLLAFLGDRAIGYYFSKVTRNSQFRFSKLYNSNDTADVVFLGNSRGLTFYLPAAEAVSQKKCVNLSYNGMPADLSKNLFFDYLDHHPKPEIVVIDVTMCDRNNDPLKQGFLLFTPSSKRLDTLVRGINPPENKSIGKKIMFGSMISHLYRYNNELFQRVLFHRNKTDKDVINDRVITELAANDTAFKSYQVRMFKERVADLKEIIDTARARNIAVKLVINPYYPAFADVVRDSFLAPLKSYVEQETQMPVADFSKALNERDEFGDYQHANKKGSAHYMSILNENNIFSNQPVAISFQPSSSNEPLALSLEPSHNRDSSRLITQSSQLLTVSNTNVKPTRKLISKPYRKNYEDSNSGSWISVDTMFSN